MKKFFIITILAFLIINKSHAQIFEMKDVLNFDEPPEIEKTCEKCAYLEGGKKF